MKHCVYCRMKQVFSFQFFFTPLILFFTGVISVTPQSGRIFIELFSHSIFFKYIMYLSPLSSLVLAIPRIKKNRHLWRFYFFLWQEKGEKLLRQRWLKCLFFFFYLKTNAWFLRLLLYCLLLNWLSTCTQSVVTCKVITSIRRKKK